MLKNLSKLLNKIYPISDFLYLLQLEEYETERYFFRLKRFFWRRNLQQRDKLIFTKRIKITLCFALPLIIVTPPLTPLWIGLGNLILDPYFSAIKLRLQRKAAKYFLITNKKTKVIAVAGSYGKTTTKNYIYELIKYNYKTQMIPGNINTPTGIANWIISNFDPTSEILIVEVDSYFIGEIGRSLKITPPDISILTNVGDQHLERLRNKLNLKKALNEVFDYSKPNAIKIQNKKSNLEYALEVARVLKIPDDIIKSSLKNLKSPDRRRNIIEINGFDVIDDSYNSTPHGMKAALEVLAQTEGDKKFILTTGVIELGKESEAVHKKLGKMMEEICDFVLLRNSEFILLIKSGMSDGSKVRLMRDPQDMINFFEKEGSGKSVVLIEGRLPQVVEYFKSKKQ